MCVCVCVYRSINRKAKANTLLTIWPSFIPTRHQATASRTQTGGPHTGLVYNLWLHFVPRHKPSPLKVIIGGHSLTKGTKRERSEYIMTHKAHGIKKSVCRVWRTFAHELHLTIGWGRTGGLWLWFSFGFCALWKSSPDHPRGRTELSSGGGCVNFLDVSAGSMEGHAP